MLFSPFGLRVAQYSTVCFSEKSKNKRLPLTTPTMSYPSPLPFTSRLPSDWFRCNGPHSSESHVPFTLIAAGSFWESSQAFPSTSTLAAAREVGKDVHNNSNVTARVSCFMKDIPLLLPAQARMPTVLSNAWPFFRVSDQIGNWRSFTCKLTDVPLVLARG